MEPATGGPATSGLARCLAIRSQALQRVRARVRRLGRGLSMLLNKPAPQNAPPRMAFGRGLPRRPRSDLEVVAASVRPLRLDDLRPLSLLRRRTRYRSPLRAPTGRDALHAGY